MQIVSTIYAGYTIKTEDNAFLVCGTSKIRKTYRYVCRDKDGNIVSIRREDLLQAQRDGDAVVVL
jgi:hypothetical protein